MPAIGRPALLDAGFHHHLLTDAARLDAYAEGIARVVRAGDIVVDVGSGTGVLAALAARAGAMRVYAIETNTYSYRNLVRFVRMNDLIGRVVPTLADGTTWRPQARVDVVVCELMETGLLHESIAGVMRNVHAWDETPREVVPQRVSLYAEGVSLTASFRGYRAPLSGFRLAKAEHALTPPHEYARFDFRQDPPPEGVDARFDLECHEDGRIEGLQLWTMTEVAPGVELREGPAYCSPLVLALDAPIEVAAGDKLAARLSYSFEYDDSPISFEIAPP